MQRLLPAAPAAVFVADDTMAIGALKALRHVGWHLLVGAALVGLDDLPLASAVEPALTTIGRQIAGMGATSVEVLLRLLNSPGWRCVAAAPGCITHRAGGAISLRRVDLNSSHSGIYRVARSETGYSNVEFILASV